MTSVNLQMICKWVLMALMLVCVPMASAPREKPDGLLWKLTKANRVLYVLGVAHAMPEKYAAIPRHVHVAYEESRTLLIESVRVRSDQASIAKTREGLAASSVSKDRFSSEKTEEGLRRLRDKGWLTPNLERVIRNSTGFELEDYFGPLIMDAVKEAVGEAAFTSDQYSPGWDQRLFALATSRQSGQPKRVRTLESSTAPQDEWLENCDRTEMHGLLLNAIVDFAENPVEFWRTYQTTSTLIYFGKLQEFEAHATSLLRKSHAYRLAQECSTEPRSIRWVDRINAFANAGPIFVAVGAGHLIFEQSLIRLLEKDGYVSQRIVSS